MCRFSSPSATLPRLFRKPSTRLLRPAAALEEAWEEEEEKVEEEKEEEEWVL